MKTPRILRQISRVIDKALVSEFRSQGHSLTGKTERSIKGRIEGDRLEGEMLSHGFIVDAGTTSGKIPFKSGSGAGKSKYIEGLKMYFKLRGLPEKEAERAAFATAKVQKKEGMSTSGSKRFSKTGDRQNFIDIASNKVEKEVDRIVSVGMDDIFDTEFNKQKSERI